ncbi:hypothetical protein U2F10_02750 [Leptothoe sp. EHU-05/26/07-4]
MQKLALAAQDSAASAKADGRVMAETMERVNLLAEINDAFLELLEPLHRWLSKVMEKRRQLHEVSVGKESLVYGDRLPGDKVNQKGGG